MKLACEIPVSLLEELTPVTDYDFVIGSHCLHDFTYKNFYKSLRQTDPTRFLILDNGAFEEGSAIATDAYKEIIQELAPNLVVLPDEVNNCRATINKSADFIENNAYLMASYFWMGVLQGNTVEEYLRCLEFYISASDDISYIGIPYHLFYRPMFIEKNNIISRCVDNGLRIHILGLPNPFELCELAKWKDVIETIDTSLPIVSGKNRKLIESFEWQRERVNIEDIYDENQKYLARKNIEFLKALISTNES